MSEGCMSANIIKNNLLYYIDIDITIINLTINFTAFYKKHFIHEIIYYCP